MNVNIRYFKVIGDKKQTVEPPNGFPDTIDIIEHIRPGMSDGVALSLTMGEYIRTNRLDLPRGILFEKAP